MFVYYSGHGAPDIQGKNGFIVPYEGQPDSPSKLYPLQAMYDSLSKLPVKEVVVMLDSCFSGAKGRSITSEGARTLVMTLKPGAARPVHLLYIEGHEGRGGYKKDRFRGTRGPFSVCEGERGRKGFARAEPGPDTGPPAFG